MIRGETFSNCSEKDYIWMYIATLGLLNVKLNCIKKSSDMSTYLFVYLSEAIFLLFDRLVTNTGVAGGGGGHKGATPPPPLIGELKKK